MKQQFDGMDFEQDMENPVHAGFTARTVIIPICVTEWMDDAAANHSKPAKAEKSRGRGSRIPNGWLLA